MGFWDNKCDDLTKQLWIPEELFWKPDERADFKTDNKYISFNYYTNKNAKIDPKLKFEPLPIVDNLEAKYKLEVSLNNKEYKRFCKDLDKKNNKISDQKIYEKHYLQIEKIEEKVNNLDGFIKSHSTRIFPTPQQKRIIQQWYYDGTSVYNKLVSHFTQIYTKYDKIATDEAKEVVDKSKLLGQYLKNNDEFPLNFIELRNLKIKEYCEDYYKTPYCIIADVIKEFISNVKGNVTKLIDEQITAFTFKHRKYNRINRVLTIESHYTTAQGFYPSILGSMESDDPNFSWDNVKHDYKLLYNKHTKKYFIHVPKYVFPKETIIRKQIAIMDPGERTFQMLYGLDHVIAIGDNMRMIIGDTLKRIDNIKSMLSKKGKWKYNNKLKKKTRIRKHKYKKAIERCHRKVDGLQRELHYKTAIYLCEHYDRIMVTDFSSKKVSSKEGDLEPMTKRVLQKLSHYKFRQRLKQKCEEYNCQYIEVNEAYTSKTCCRCGNVDNLLGANKEYNCKKCGNKIARDINGAICIFLKNQMYVLK